MLKNCLAGEQGMNKKHPDHLSRLLLFQVLPVLFTLNGKPFEI